MDRSKEGLGRVKTQSRAALEVECHPPCADALRGRRLLRVAPGAARAHPEVCVSRGEESCLSWNDPNRHVSLWAFSLFEVRALKLTSHEYAKMFAYLFTSRVL